MDLGLVEGVILNIQNKLPVHTYIYKGRLIWPILRRSIYYESIFRSINNKNGEKTDSTGAQREKKSHQPQPKNKFISWLLVIREFLINYFYYQRSFNVLKKNKSELIFLFQRSLYYPDKAENKEYSRYIDPYYEVLRKKYSAIKIHIDEDGIDIDNEYLYPPLLIDPRRYFLYRRHRNTIFKKATNKRDLESLGAVLDGLNEELEKLDSEFKFDILQTYYYIEKIIDYEVFYLKLFKAISPKVLLMVGYYEEPFQLAALAVCKKLNIKTFDILHGKGSLSYENWNYKYNYLPDYVWVWTKEKFKKLEKVNTFLLPFLGGNMWTKRKLDSNISSSLSSSFLLNLQSFDKVILISLQPHISYLVFDLIIKLIQQSPENWFWCLRFHPMMSDKEKNKFIDALVAFRNVDYLNSTECNLYDIFKVCDIQLTQTSTTALEGLTFKLPCILIHENGKHAFQEMVEKGIFLYTEDLVEIAEIIKNGYKLPPIDDYSIVQKEEVVLEKFKAILN